MVLVHGGCGCNFDDFLWRLFFYGLGLLVCLLAGLLIMLYVESLRVKFPYTAFFSC